MGGTKFWREIERNFGHKRNRLGANAAREFEVFFKFVAHTFNNLFKAIVVPRMRKELVCVTTKTKLPPTTARNCAELFPMSLKLGSSAAARANLRVRSALGDNAIHLEPCPRRQ